jgi:beta-lactam-binding protein with PASTA domain
VFQFITRQNFFVNLLAAGLLVLLLLLGMLQMLGFITRHGQYEKVPLVTGKQLPDAVAALEQKGFSVEVQDSVWDATLPPLAVLKQQPGGDDLVKAKRTIYLTVNRSQPPMIEMPNLVGLSFRNAELYLRQLGLRLGDTLRKPDIAKDAVLEQLFRGVPLRPGTKIFQGSAVSFVLGSGLGADQVEVPMLIGMTYQEVGQMLSGLGLQPGALIVEADVKDTAMAYVYKQNPEVEELLPEGGTRKIMMRPGQSIDLWLGTTRVVPAVDSAALQPQLQ